MFIDILLLAIVAIVTWCVASEGAWGAGLMCLCVLFAGLLAMNFFEPFANGLESSLSSSASWRYRWDIISLVGLFAVFVLLLRTGIERLTPGYISVHPLVYEIGRWGTAALTGYVTMAFLLTALHTAPLPREFIGFRPERANFFGMTAPDLQWLGFTQYVSENVFHQRHGGRVFDGPQFEKGDHKGIWPSFPIRYATRREMLASGQADAAGSTRAPIEVRESGSGGSGEPDF